MGETYESYYDFVREYAPDVVVLETSTPTVRVDLAIAARLRELVPGVKVLFTGLHFELEQVSFLENHPEVDFAIHGEYEISATKLLRALRDGTSLEAVPALMYRSGASIRKNPFGTLVDLAKFPWAEREGLPNLNYFDGVCGLPRPQLQLMATRGCPYGCIFCAWPQMLYRGPTYRKRPAQDVVDEIKANLDKLPYKSVYIDDDTVNISKTYVVELATKLREAEIGGRVPWSTMGRADLMDQPTLAALRDAGLFSIKYGVESANQAILDEIDKRAKLENVLEMVRLTKEYGIRVHLTYTFGLPSDTPETIEKTIEVACALPVDTVQFSIATPFPGTEMYRMYEEKGWIASKNWDDYIGSNSAVSRTQNFTGEQLEFYVAEAYRRFAEAQTARGVQSAEVPEKLHAAATNTLSAGDPVLVMQTSRPPLTRWLVRTLKTWGYDVHLATPARFRKEFGTLLPNERIHTFEGQSHFRFDLHAEWARQLRSKFAFKGAFIPYSFASRQGYEDVERLAVEFAGRIVAGVTPEGQVLR
jgi:radical SAM superfamily enzyme YgiQ (UPF0313 family)